MTKAELKDFLDHKYISFNNHAFVEEDPILIPHGFTRKEDIEISGFLTATIAWGQRKTIIKNAKSLMERMDHDPYRYIMEASEQEMNSLDGFVHRTFNEIDLKHFVVSLRRIYQDHGLELLFQDGILEGMELLQQYFFPGDHPLRTQKHVANPKKNSSAKRINMFLRWMVRKDHRGVDFGLWEVVNPRQLFLPLDVHSGNVARQLKLLSRKQNDWKAVEEVTLALREFDPEDPIKYDFALFGLGVYEKF